jgi:hypothetical protein
VEENSSAGAGLIPASYTSLMPLLADGG